MRRLIILVIVAAAAWYGWKHYKGLRSGPSDIAVIANDSGRAIERVRLTVDGQTLVREVLEDGATAELPFRVRKDSSFHLHWQWRGREGEPQWDGGLVTAGPLVSRNTFRVQADGGVIWSASPIGGTPGN